MGDGSIDEILLITCVDDRLKPALRPYADQFEYDGRKLLFCDEVHINMQGFQPRCLAHDAFSSPVRRFCLRRCLRPFIP